jgi:hypothetical protein
VSLRTALSPRFGGFILAGSLLGSGWLAGGHSFRGRKRPRPSLPKRREPRSRLSVIAVSGRSFHPHLARPELRTTTLNWDSIGGRKRITAVVRDGKKAQVSRDRKRRSTGKKVEGRKSHKEAHPEVVALARSLAPVRVGARCLSGPFRPPWRRPTT